jgi:hypothetical protein
MYEYCMEEDNQDPLCVGVMKTTVFSICLVSSYQVMRRNKLAIGVSGLSASGGRAEVI